MPQRTATFGLGGWRPDLRLDGLAVVWLLMASQLCGLDRASSLSQLAHESYTQRAGFAIPPVRALAQTQDGYLWVGTEAGLLRFDGVRLRGWEELTAQRLPATQIWALAATKDGGLWVAASNALFLCRDGRLVPESNLLVERGRVMRVVVAPGGTVWAAATEEGVWKLWRNDGKGWKSIAYPTSPAPIVALEAAADGRILLSAKGILEGDESGTFRMVYASPSQMQCFTVQPDGGVWISPSSGVLQLFDHQYRPTANKLKAPSSAQVALVDRDLGLWVGTSAEGISRWTVGMQQMNRREGLSGDTVRAMLEDREGNIWVGTQNGLDRFSALRVRRVTTAEGLGTDRITAIHSASEGGIWIGSRTMLEKVVAGVVEKPFPKGFVGLNGVISMEEDSAGRLLLGMVEGLFVFAGGKLQPVPGAPKDVTVQIARGREGELGLLTRNGVFVWSQGKTEELKLPALPGRQKPLTIHMSREGRLWVGHTRGGVIIREPQGKFTVIAEEQNTPRGAIYAIAEDGRGRMWLGDEQGLSRWAAGKWSRWSLGDGMAGGAHDLLFDAEDALWIRTNLGVMKVARKLLDGAAGTPAGRLVGEVYGVEQGMRLEPVVPWVNPRSARDSKGNLWFTTDEGVAVLEGKKVRQNKEGPAVRIEELRADGKPVPIIAGKAELPEMARDLQFEYTALSFQSPARNRFRYRLEGFDPDWVEAGTRRVASYGNLRPKDYRFRVIAADADGVWNEVGEAVEFNIPPAFYESVWFYLLLLVVVATGAYGFHWSRMRQLALRQELVLEERARIARELHDRLLQGIAGATWQLDALASELPAAAGREKIERVLSQMDRSMTEARQSISALRIPTVGSDRLPEMLGELGRSLTGDNGARFELLVKGERRAIPAIAEENLFAICREAILNALRHGKPQRITGTIEYRERGIFLSVVDDGIGFDPEAVAAKQGHWGLTGIRERATQLRGNVTLVSEPGKGCQVEVVLPRV